MQQRGLIYLVHPRSYCVPGSRDASAANTSHLTKLNGKLVPEAAVHTPEEVAHVRN